MLLQLSCTLVLLFSHLASGLDVYRNESISTNTTTTVASTDDISSLVDEFVESWKQSNPGLGSVELNSIMASANAAKEALISPVTKAKRHQPAYTMPLTPLPVPHRRRQLGNSTLSSNATLEAARALVRRAQEEADIRNLERFQNPRLNNYYDDLGKEAALKARANDMATLTVNETVAAAAALVAEADAATKAPAEYEGLPADILAVKNEMSGKSSGEVNDLSKRATTGFWMEDIAHSGSVPYGDDNGYTVFRNVKDYGAVGDGVTDDTEAINNAIKDGDRCGANCGSSSVKPAIVYFPSGTYLVSSSILAYYNTQLIGNANDRPIIKAATSFIGLGVISSDVYTGGNNGEDEWYINQNNFLRQVRNFVVDVRDSELNNIAGIHWQVAQATSIQNVAFYQSSSTSMNHVGVFAENGSGGFMSDLLFVNGAIGLHCGNQQFTTRDLIFLGCRTGIQLLWDWGWTWKSIIMQTSEYGIRMNGTYQGGSLVLLDSYISATPYGIYVETPLGNTESEKFTITIDNLQIVNVGTTVRHRTAGVSLAGGTTTIESWMMGKVYDSSNPTGTYQSGPLASLHPKTKSLMGTSGYFQQGKPQYADFDANSFLNARPIASGDGISDDSFALSLLFTLSAKLNRLVFIPFGSYIVTKTVEIPVGARVVGECWSQIVAKGPYFSEYLNPAVMLRVGAEGDTGVVELQDLMFTTVGPTAGVVLMEWNVAQDEQGSAAMWDCHFRIGGAQGSQLTASDCPKLTGSVNSNCIAGSMLLHMTETSSGYLENVWAWVADHDLDSGTAQTQIDIYVARGILIESTGGPVWMYGTASEHTVLYQYLLYGASDVFMGMIQTESPYYLPNPQAPAPFGEAVGLFNGDPDFSDCSDSDPHCAAAWGLMIIGSTNIHILGAGLYNWFQAYTQPCVDSQDCQQSVVNIRDSGNVWLYNLYTIGTVEMVTPKGATTILATDNTNTNGHPFTSIINAWLVMSDGDGILGGDDLRDELVEYISKDRFASCNAIFTSLEQISNSASGIPDHCFDKYIVDVQLSIMGTALHTYVDIVSDGYDDKFQIYEDVVSEQVPSSIDAYMSKVADYGTFTCTQHKYVTCCGSCSGPYGVCATCSTSCSKSGYQDISVSCPTSITDPYDIYQNAPPAITYHLTDEAKFHDTISTDYGISSDWFTLSSRLAFLGNGCQYAGEDVEECIKETGIYWENYPVVGTIEIANPKDIVSKSYDNSVRLYDRASVAQQFGDYQIGMTSHSEMVDALSIAAMTLAEAVSAMQSVVTVAEDEIERRRKEDISNFIMAIFMLIPMAGEVAGAVGGATMRAIIEIAGELANVGVTIYELVDSPKSALTTIFGFLLGGGLSRQPFKEAAAARRGMSSDELGKMAPRIKTDLATINDLRTMCLRK